MRSLDKAELAQRDRDAIEVAAKMLKGRFPVERVVLFGSKARGDDEEDSDIDLLLITHRPLHWRERKAIIEALFDIEMAYDVIISILVATTSDWENGILTACPIYEEIVQDGLLAA